MGGRRALARAVIFYPGPRVLANSIPKAGTHLLTSALARLPRMMSSGVHHALNDFSVSVGAAPEVIPEIDTEGLGRALSSINKGQFMSAHFPASPHLPPLLSQRGYKNVLIIRDPRDVIVSHTHYVTHTRRHFLFERYNRLYSNDDQRLMASIQGFAAGEMGPGQESVTARFAKYTPWIDDPDTYVCRFENLIGPSGGGTRSAQVAEIKAIAEHVDRALDEDAFERAAAAVWSERTPTFRKGRAGDWRNHFAPEHEDAFKAIAGDLLIDLGYEKDLSW